MWVLGQPRWGVPLLDFLDLWFAHSQPLLEIRPLRKHQPRTIYSRWFSDPTSARAFLAELNGADHEAHIGCLPRDREAGDTAAVSRYDWLWADLDIAGPTHAQSALQSQPEALAALSRLPTPTALVDSGYGLHAWWAVSGSQSLDQWRARMAGIASVLGADPNATHSPAQTLRLPGSLNLKLGPPGVPCRLLEASGVVHDPATFPEAAPKEKRSNVVPFTGSGPVSIVGDRPFDRANSVPILDVLRELKIKVTRHGTSLHCVCPVHGSGKNPSQAHVGGNGSNTVYCHGDCQCAHTPVDVVAGHLRISAEDAVDWLADRFRFEGLSAKRAAKREALRPVSGPGAVAGAVAGPSRVSAQVVNLADRSVRQVLSTSAVPIQPAASGSVPDHEEIPPLILGKGSQLRCNQENAMLILGGRNGIYGPVREWRGCLGYDELGKDLHWLKSPPCGGIRPGPVNFNVDPTIVISWLQRDQGWEKTDEGIITRTLDQLGRCNSFNPVRQWLQSLAWDGQPRLARAAAAYLGAEDPLHQVLLRRWMIGAVARAFEPGCKFDSVLVLVGGQGVGKSTALSILGGQWFANDPIGSLGDKDSIMKMSRFWIFELAELDQYLKSGESNRVKSVITAAIDYIRPPYGRQIEACPRAGVLAGSTNVEHFLVDDTGDRRYWPVPMKGLEEGKLRADREQLWAEAVTVYQANPLERFLSPEEAREATRRNEHYSGSDLAMDPYMEILATLPDKDTTIQEVLNNPLGFTRDRIGPKDARRVAKVLRALGWQPVAIRNGSGVRRVWRRQT